MVTRNCNYCNEKYEAEPRYLNRGQGVCCSRDCGTRYAAGLRKVTHEPNHECGYCKKPMYVKPSQEKNSKSGFFFCSREHQSQAFSDPSIPVWSGPAPSNGRPRNWKVRTHAPKCLGECGKGTLAKSGRCQECHKIYLIEQWLNGDVDVTWIGAANVPAPWVKEYLISVRGDKCEVCGWNELAPDGHSIIQMDHVDGNYLNNRIENLKLLCPNHHAMTPTYGSRNKNGRRERSKYYIYESWK